MNKIDFQLKQKIFKRDNFQCQKCGFIDKSCQELKVHHITPLVFGGKNNPDNLITLCTICYNYAPNSKEEFIKYINEKINGEVLNTFRKSNNSISKKTKEGMINLFEQGKHVTRAPKGYSLIDKKLIPNQEKEEVKKIFKEFLDTNISLTQLAKKYSMTTSGIKKLLSNSTYIGKVKFANKEIQGIHKPLISKDIFDKTQEKLKQKYWTIKTEI